MKKKQSYIAFCLIFLLFVLSTMYFFKNKLNQPNQQELLVGDLEKYANNLVHYYPFITGLIPELVDQKGGNLPLTASHQFDQLGLLYKIEIMERLTNNAIDEDQTPSGIFAFNRHIHERVIIRTISGQYSFLKSSHTFTLPSGITFNEDNYHTLYKIKNKSVALEDDQLSVKAEWGIPIQTEKKEDKIINTYNNEAVVTFIDDKAVSIYLKGVDALAGETYY